MKVKEVSDFLLQYLGLRICNHLDLRQKNVFLANYEQMRANYGDTVDGQLLNCQILLCEETVKELYSDAWQKTHYRKGSRPQLESIVSALTENAHTQWEKVLSIMRFCRDLYKKENGKLLFYGGTEEELMKKGEQLCECLARLMVALCEIAEIAGRIVTHIGGGHLTCEVCVNSRWAYIDPRAGIFYLKTDGTVASVWDLLQNPSIMDDQPEWVKNEVSPRWTWEIRNEKCRNYFFHAREVNTVKPYSLSDCALYSYEWLALEDFRWDGLESKCAAYRKAICENFGEEYVSKKAYFAFSVSDEQILREPISIFAIPKNVAMYPQQVRFYLDGEIVWESPKCISPSELLTAYTGVFCLFGTDGEFRPNDYADGLHELYVEDVADAACNGKVAFYCKKEKA